MIDVISREQFREQMYHRCFEVNNDSNMQKWDSGLWIRYKLFEEELEKAPSIVTCKDCKHFYADAECGQACELTEMRVEAEDFCSYGERKESEEE